MHLQANETIQEGFALVEFEAAELLIAAELALVDLGDLMPS